MVVVIRSHRIAYFPVPKCANTSIKAALGKACASADLVDTGNQPMSARLRRKTRGCFRIAVIREPRRRALSAYGNRVVHRRDVARAPIGRFLLPLFGLDPVPGPDEFFLNLRTYAALSKRLRRHVRPQAAYLGHDLSFFDAVYKIEELDRLADDLSARLGVSVEFDRLQTGGPKIPPSELSQPAFDALDRHIAPDFDLIRDHYGTQ